MTRALRNTVTILAAGLSLAAGGCGLIKVPDAPVPISSPTATVERVELVDASDEAGRYLIYVNIDNPNDQALPMTDATYRINVNGAAVDGYATDVVPNATLPANAALQVKLAAVLTTPSAPGAAGDYNVTGRFRLYPPGEIKKIGYEIGWPRPTVAFAGQGPVTENLGAEVYESEVDVPDELEGDTTTPTAPRTAPDETEAPATDESTPTTPGVDIE